MYVYIYIYICYCIWISDDDEKEGRAGFLPTPPSPLAINPLAFVTSSPPPPLLYNKTSQWLPLHLVPLRCPRTLAAAPLNDSPLSPIAPWHARRPRILHRNSAWNSGPDRNRTASLRAPPDQRTPRARARARGGWILRWGFLGLDLQRMGAPKQRWTPEEEAALKAGVAKHGPGKWRTILRDSDFSELLRLRSNVDLKVTLGSPGRVGGGGFLAISWGEHGGNLQSFLVGY